MRGDEPQLSDPRIPKPTPLKATERKLLYGAEHDKTEHLADGQDAATYGQGCAFNLCCTEYCDVTDGGFTCAGSGQQCVALFEATDQYYASVGACMVP